MKFLKLSKSSRSLAGTPAFKRAPILFPIVFSSDSDSKSYRSFQISSISFFRDAMILEMSETFPARVLNNFFCWSVNSSAGYCAYSAISFFPNDWNSSRVCKELVVRILSVCSRNVVVLLTSFIRRWIFALLSSSFSKIPRAVRASETYPISSKERMSFFIRCSYRSISATAWQRCVGNHSDRFVSK